MAATTMDVRQAAPGTAVVDISGEVTSASEDTMMAAYQGATDDGAKAIVLNFAGLDYMNSSGIGLLVTMLVRANRHGQAIRACGLSDHYRQIFELTRLDDAIGIYESEADAVSASG